MADYYGPAVGGRQLMLSITHTQNIAGNFSQVRTIMYLINGSYVADSAMQVGVAVGGVQAYWWQGNAAYSAGTVLLADTTRNVPHNSAGQASVSFAGGVYGAGAGFINLGVNVNDLTLPTIPRATTPNWSGDFTAGTAKTINLPRASSEFVHDVRYAFGTESGWISADAGAATTWTPPMELIEQITDAASGSGTISVVTRSGSTVIGTKNATFKLNVGSGIVPAVSQVIWDDDNSTVKTNIGAFVQGLSLVKGTVTAAGVYGSTVAERRLRIGATVLPENTAFQVAGSGTVVASGEATDSRGRVGSKSANFGVLPYSPPTIGSGGWQVSRANASNVATDTGTYLRIDLHALVSSLKLGATEKNALTIKVRTRPIGGAWTARNTITPGLTYNTAFQISGGAVFLVTNSYEVEITLADKTGIEATRLLTTIPTATVTLDMNGTKVGVGKYWEQGALDVGGEVVSSTALTVFAAGKATSLVPAGITSSEPFALNPRTTRPGNTFNLKSQLDAWTTAPNGTTAWVSTEACEYVRVGGVWKSTALGYAGLRIAGTTWDNGGGIFGGGTQTTISESGATVGARRITPTIAGRWQATLTGVWADNSTGLREATLRRNGVNALSTDAPGNFAGVLVPASSRSEYSITLPDIEMNGTTDYVEFVLYQSSGVRLTNTWTALTMQQID